MSQKIFLGDDIQKVSVLEQGWDQVHGLVSLEQRQQRSLAAEEQAEKRIQGFITYVL